MNYSFCTLPKVRIQRYIYIIYIGSTGGPICPVYAMSEYLHSVYHESSPSDPLFKFQNGFILTRSLLVNHTKLVLSAIGIDPKGYTGHSYMVGGATSAAAAGLQDWEIKLMGSWNSDTYQQYIKAPRSLVTGFAKRVIHVTNQSFTFRRPYLHFK